MTEAKRRIDEIGEESRRRILDAAEALFAEKGFEQTTFIDIAKRSGISRGSIPWHFTNKDGLLIAVADRAIERSLRGYDEVPTLPQVMEDFAELVHHAGPQMLLVILTEALKSTGPLRSQYAEWLGAQRGGFRGWIRLRRPEDIDRDRAREQEERLATVINGAMVGIQMQWQLDPDSVDLEAALTMLASVVESYLERLWDAAVPEATTSDG